MALDNYWFIIRLCFFFRSRKRTWDLNFAIIFVTKLAPQFFESMDLKVNFNCSSIAEITKGSLDLSRWAKQYFPVLVKKYACGKKKIWELHLKSYCIYQLAENGPVVIYGPVIWTHNKPIGLNSGFRPTV